MEGLAAPGAAAVGPTFGAGIFWQGGSHGSKIRRIKVLLFAGCLKFVLNSK